MASVRDARADAGKPPPHHPLLPHKVNYKGTYKVNNYKVTISSSYLGSVLKVGCPIRIAGSLHSVELWKQINTPCTHSHPRFAEIKTTRTQTCIRIADEKTHMQLQVHGHRTCPKISMKRHSLPVCVRSTSKRRFAKKVK